MAIKKCWYLSHFINGNCSCTYSKIRTETELLKNLDFSTERFLGTTLSDLHKKYLIMTTGGHATVQDEDGAIHTWIVGQVKYNSEI